MAEVELKTAPADFRFPTTNQTRHCFTRYIEFHRCLAVKGEESSECERFGKYYRSLCPGEWIIILKQVANLFQEHGCLKLILMPSTGKTPVERWNEQRENGTFPGPL